MVANRRGKYYVDMNTGNIGGLVSFVYFFTHFNTESVLNTCMISTEKVFKKYHVTNTNILTLARTWGGGGGCHPTGRGGVSYTVGGTAAPPTSDLPHQLFRF